MTYLVKDRETEEVIDQRECKDKTELLENYDYSDEYFCIEEVA